MEKLERRLAETFRDPRMRELAIRFLEAVPSSLGEPPYNGCHEGSIRHHAAQSSPHILAAGTLLKEGGIPFWLERWGYIRYAGSNEGQALYVRNTDGQISHS